MPILHFLLSKAMASGNIAITQGEEGYNLCYRWCGIWLTIASMTKAEAASAQRALEGRVI